MASNNSYSSHDVDTVTIFLVGVIAYRLFQFLIRHILIKKPRVLFYLIVISIVLFVLLICCVMLMQFKRRQSTDKELKPNLWSRMNGRQFEDQIVTWLKHQDYSAVTKTEYFDKGVDILAVKDSLSFGIQVKRSKNRVGVAAVRAAVTALKSYDCDKAIVITNSEFTSQARHLAKVNDCLLIDGNELRTHL